MISALNQLVDLVEEHLTEELDLEGLAAGLGTTEYHLRRMFSSLAGMPLSEYVRRRRMTVASGDVVRGEEDLLEIAVRYGYGSRSVRTCVPGGSRRRSRGGAPQRRPLAYTAAAQVPPDRRREHSHGHPPRRPPRVPPGRTLHPGPAHPPRGQPAHPAAHRRHPRGGAPAPEGSERLRAGRSAPGHRRRRPGRTGGHRADLPARCRRRHGDARSGRARRHRGAAGVWAVFRTSGPHPEALQTAWAAIATEWFPSNPWRLRPGPSVVAVLERADDFSTATCELWLPVESA